MNNQTTELDHRDSTYKSNYMKTSSNQLSTLAAAIALLAAASTACAQTYKAIPINPPAGTYACFGQGLNNPGQVVGYTTSKVGTGKKATTVRGPAFLWEGGQSIALPPVAGKQFAEAHAISDTGLAVGVSYDLVSGSMSDLRATGWIQNPDGSVTGIDFNSILPSGSGAVLNEAWAVSEDGRSITVDDNTYGGTMLLELNSSRDFTSVTPLGNNTWVWDVRGLADDDLKITGDSNGHAFLWDSGTFTDLHPNLPGSSYGCAVNALGQVAGVYRVSGANRPAYWNGNGQYVDIFAGKATGGDALGINDAGAVVGWATLKKPGPTSTVFLWQPATGAKDLNSLKSPSDTTGITISWAGKINQAGQILARGSTKTASTFVLLNPE